jgi:hypothetical protein
MARHFTRRAILLSGVAATVLLSRTAFSAWPLVTVHKDPTCGCCGGWVAHLETHGYQVKVIETTEINRVKARLGVPFDLGTGRRVFDRGTRARNRAGKILAGET